MSPLNPYKIPCVVEARVPIAAAEPVIDEDGTPKADDICAHREHAIETRETVGIIEI